MRTLSWKTMEPEKKRLSNGYPLSLKLTSLSSSLFSILTYIYYENYLSFIYSQINSFSCSPQMNYGTNIAKFIEVLNFTLCRTRVEILCNLSPRHS